MISSINNAIRVVKYFFDYIGGTNVNENRKETTNPTFNLFLKYFGEKKIHGMFTRILSLILEPKPYSGWCTEYIKIWFENFSPY